MLCRAATALIALLVFCFAPLALVDAGGRVGDRGVVAERLASTMSNGPIGAANAPARKFIAEQTGAFAASPLVPRVRFGRGSGAAGTKRWIKLTAPSGEPIYVNMEQIASIRSDSESPGANTHLELASGKFQRVQEAVEQVMRLISAISDAQETDEPSSVAGSAARRLP
jgi:hypothetical protein